MKLIVLGAGIAGVSGGYVQLPDFAVANCFAQTGFVCRRQRLETDAVEGQNGNG